LADINARFGSLLEYGVFFLFFLFCFSFLPSLSWRVCFVSAFFKRVALRKRARLDVEVCVLAGSGELEGPLLAELAGGGMSAAAGFTENDPRG